MSGSGAKRTDAAEREALTRLEAVVGRLIDRSEELSARASKAEARARELETLLKRFAKGDSDPALLQATVTALRSEAEDLRKRLHAGREGVDRILSRMRFLEER